MAARTQPTAEEWKEIEREAMTMYSRARLLVDGYEVDLQLGKLSKMKLGICIWVNGAFKGEWCQPGHDVARRFYDTKTVRLFSPKQIKEFEKKFGKRSAKSQGFYNSFESVRAYWTSFARLKSHLIKNNDQIIWHNDRAKEACAA